MDELQVRPATTDDAAAIAAITNTEEILWWGEAETDEAEIRHTLGWVGDLTGRSVIVEAGGRVVGCAFHTPEGGGSLASDAAGDPQQRARVLDMLMAWLAARGAKDVDAPIGDDQRLAAYTQHGYVPARASFELEAEPGSIVEAPWPAGVERRGFDVATEAQVAHDLIYSVWTTVPGHNHRPLDEWRVLFCDFEGYDPGLQVTAWREGRMVGIALCRVYGGRWGWLAQLAVAADEQGRGTGRALLSAALSGLAAVDGLESVGLSVNAENDRALALYRSVGLSITREYAICEPRATAGVDP